MHHESFLPQPAVFAADIRSREALAPSAVFLPVLRVTGAFRYAGAPAGPRQDMSYEVVERPALDAAVVVAYFDHTSGERHVYLRECARVPLLLRAESSAECVQWELCAGLIEQGETPAEAALREACEELGVLPAYAETLDLQPLGTYVYPAPGVLAERQFFFALRLPKSACGQPLGDGSGWESGARVIDVPLKAALACARAGKLRDSKSELGLRRLQEYVA